MLGRLALARLDLAGTGRLGAVPRLGAGLRCPGEAVGVAGVAQLLAAHLRVGEAFGAEASHQVRRMADPSGSGADWGSGTSQSMRIRRRNDAASATAM